MNVDMLVLSPPEPEDPLVKIFIQYGLPLIAIFVVYALTSRQGNNPMMNQVNFMKTKREVIVDGETGVKFEDVAGVDEAKFEL